MEIIKARRFVARNVWNGVRMEPLRFVDLSGETMEVAPFERETAATVFIDCMVVLLKADKVNLNLEDEHQQFTEEQLAFSGEPASNVIPLTLD
jgi:hypothetical protein